MQNGVFIPEQKKTQAHAALQKL